MGDYSNMIVLVTSSQRPIPPKFVESNAPIVSGSIQIFVPWYDSVQNFLPYTTSVGRRWHLRVCLVAVFAAVLGIVGAMIVFTS